MRANKPFGPPQPGQVIQGLPILIEPRTQLCVGARIVMTRQWRHVPILRLRHLSGPPIWKIYFLRDTAVVRASCVRRVSSKVCWRPWESARWRPARNHWISPEWPWGLPAGGQTKRTSPRFSAIALHPARGPAGRPSRPVGQSWIDAAGTSRSTCPSPAWQRIPRAVDPSSVAPRFTVHVFGEGDSLPGT